MPLYIAYCIGSCIAYCPGLLGPIELPINRLGGRLGRTGSWAGPAWFKMLLGLGGNQGGGGGGKGVISCTSSITFHLVARKKIYIRSSILEFRYASFGDDGIGKISYR